MGLKILKQESTLDPVLITELTSIMSYTLIAREAIVSQVTIKGLNLHIKKDSLIRDELKENKSIHSLIGEEVVFYLPQMNLDMEGIITEASSIEEDLFEVFISFNSQVPGYWKKCLLDLFPKV